MIDKYSCYGDEMRQSLNGSSIKSSDVWPTPEGQIYVQNDTSKDVSIWWYNFEGEAVWQETIAPWYDSYINTYAGDKFDAYDESGMEDLLLMGGEDILTVSQDHFIGETTIRISKKECEPFD